MQKIYQMFSQINPLTHGCRICYKMFPILGKRFTASQRQLVVLEEKTDRSKAVQWFIRVIRQPVFHCFFHVTDVAQHLPSPALIQGGHKSLPNKFYFFFLAENLDFFFCHAQLFHHVNNILLYPVSSAFEDTMPFSDPKIMLQVKDLAWRTPYNSTWGV